MALDTSRALPAPPSAESRIVPHIRRDRGVRLWKARWVAPVRGQLHDLSLSEYYIGLKTPAAEGTALRLLQARGGARLRPGSGPQCWNTRNGV